MTFCLGIKVEEGLVGIADTRITMGSEFISAKKLSMFTHENRPMFAMTSGLRSLRDKVMIYFEDALSEESLSMDRMHKAANLYATQLRRVAAEDMPGLTSSDLKFNINTLLGGQLEGDREHRLFLIYPEGNWVEIGEWTPYHIIGSSGYGKPVLDRTLKYADTMRFALKVGCLAFDSTRISAADVGFPIDVVLYRKGSSSILAHRYEAEDLADVASWWQDQLRQSVRNLPAEQVDQLIERLNGPDAMPSLRAVGK